MRGKFEKKRESRFPQLGRMINRVRQAKIPTAVRVGFCALLVVAAAGVFVLVQNTKGEQLEAGSDGKVYRGTVTSLSEITSTGVNDTTLGTEDNTFLILEIVPEEEYAEIGYKISGCEPVNVEDMFGDGNTTNLTSIGAGTYEYGSGYFFAEEKEADASYYKGTYYTSKEPYAQNYSDVEGKSYLGYYEVTEDGEGYFSLADDGTITKKTGGNLVWHTLNAVDGDAYTSFEADTAVPELEEVGDRYYTYRTVTEDDTVYVSWLWRYTSSNDFLVNVLGLSGDDLDTYSIVVKTITPQELNETPEWIDVATLITISATIQNTELLKIWSDHHEYENEDEEKNKTVEMTGNGCFAGKYDISAEVALKIFSRLTSDTKEYSSLILNVVSYTPTQANSAGECIANYGKSVTFDVMNWNLQDTGLDYTDTGYDNNMYKLAVMLKCMDTDIFKMLYLDGKDDKITINSDSKLEDTLQEGDAAVYWTGYTFLAISDENAEKYKYGLYSYFAGYADDTWSAWGYNGNLLEGSNNVYVKDRVYTYNNDNTMIHPLTDEISDNSRYTDYQEWLAEDKSGDKADTGNAVEYILGLLTNSSSTSSTTLRVLDLEPGVAVAEDDATAVESGEAILGKSGFTLTEKYIRMLLNGYMGDLEITHMTTAEFIGNTDDLNSTYDLIYIGTDDGAFHTTTDKKSWNGWTEMEYTDFNDNDMDGLIYFHTGDVMYSAEYSKKGSLRTALFIDGLTGTDAENLELRFAGNDITSLKLAELQEYVEAGYPVVASGYLYDLETTFIDENTYLYQFVEEYKTETEEHEVGVYSTSQSSELVTVINQMTPQISVTKLPVAYNPDGNDADEHEYLPRNGSDQPTLSFGFTVYDSNAGNDYKYRIYVDQNQDGKFSDDEVYYTYANTFSPGTAQSVTCKLSALMLGVLQWKLEVYQVDANGEETGVRFVESGVSAIQKSTQSEKKEINVLQIMPTDDISSQGYLNLETNPDFTQYYDDLDAYKITVTAIKLDEFEAIFKDSRNEGKIFSFDFSDEIRTEEETDDNGNVLSVNPTNNTSYLQTYFDNYNMLIFGFGDSYGGQNISNEYGAVDYIKYFVAQGKSVLFTHDMTSMYNDDDDSVGYTMNTLMRDVMGMNRYKAVNSNLTSDETAELKAYQEEHAYDTVIDSKGNELEQKQGFTYYALKRIGYNSDNGYKSNLNYDKIKETDYMLPFKNLVYLLDGETTIGQYYGGIAESSGMTNANDITTTTAQLNEGQITEYPFRIDETLTVSATHAQWYQLNMEDSEVTVWYTLLYNTDDNITTTAVTSANGNASNGTPMTYAVSPYDAANNYYIYSKSNVFYSGVGHSTIASEDGNYKTLPENEVQLFINTMVAAYRASYVAPVVEIMNAEAEQTTAFEDDKDLTYEITVAQELDPTDDSNDDTNAVTVEDYGDDEIEVIFCPEELNAVSTELTMSVYYEYTDSNGETQQEYITEITNCDTGVTYAAIDNVFTVDNMQEYSFNYPKKYVDTWTDESGAEQAARSTVKFVIKNNKSAENRTTTLDFVTQQLFQLD